MAGNRTPKVRAISVEEIVGHNKALHEVAVGETEAIKELIAYLKEACSKHAYKMSDMAKIARSFCSPPISDRLKSYLERASNRKIRKNIDPLIVESYVGSYSSFQLRLGWKKIWKWSGLLPRRFYYYENDKFINLYRATDTELLLYVNHEWSCEADKEQYMDRMRNLTGGK